MTATPTATRIRLPHRYRPRPYQRNFLRAFPRHKRRAVWVVRRRAGKDLTAWSAVVIPEAAETVGLYYYLFPTYTQAEKAIWSGIDNDGISFLDRIPHQLVADKNESRMRVELINGSIIQLVGSDKYNGLVGTNVRGMVFSEWSLCDPRAWPYLAPMIGANNGWALFLYTPRGRNHGWDTLQAAQDDPDHWFAEVLTIDDTGEMVPGELEQARSDAKILGLMGDDLDTFIQQEYYCSFAAGIQGAYYAKLLEKAEQEGRIRDHLPIANVPVHTRWDLGMDDATAIWLWQQVGQEPRFVGYYENRGQGLEHYAAWLQRYSQRRDFAYGTHYLPHDGAVKELGTGKSRQEVLQGFRIGNVTVVPRQSPEDGIQASRQELAIAYFDKTECADGLKALAHYHNDWDDEKRTGSKNPVHDWSSHGADAYRTGAMVNAGPVQALPAPTPYRPRYAR